MKKTYILYNINNTKQELIDCGYYFKQGYCFKIVGRYKIEIYSNTGEVRMFKESSRDYLHRFKPCRIRTKYIKDLKKLNERILQNEN